MYLLPGIGGNDREWTAACHADAILDNLLAERKIVSMVVVFPNGNSSVTADGIPRLPARDGVRAALRLLRQHPADAAAPAGISIVGGRHSKTICCATSSLSLSRTTSG